MNDLRWCIGAGLLLFVGCFDGRDALGLPCEQDFQCGNGQVCSGGSCAWPGGDGGGPTSSSSSGTTVGSSATSSGTTEGPGPVPTTGGSDGMLVIRNISVPESGNPMSVGVGKFSDAHDVGVAVLTRSPALLSVFRFENDAFVAEDEREVAIEPMDIAVGPLDGDEFDDVVVVAGGVGGSDTVTIFWGAAGGLFLDAPTSYGQPLAFPHSVDIGRMINNESPQLLVSSGTLQNGSALLSVTDRELILREPYFPVSDSPWDTVLVDMSGGPSLEALVVGSNSAGLDGIPGSDVVQLLTASANDGISQLQELNAARSPYGVDAGDLDGDGILEVVVVGKNIDVSTVTPEESDRPSEISLCSRPELGVELSCSTWQPGKSDTGYNNIRLADLNGDGDLDAVIGTTGGTDPADGRLLVALGPLAEEFVPMELDSTGPVGNKIAIADVTGDDALDILVPLFGVQGRGQGIVRVYSFEEPQ